MIDILIKLIGVEKEYGNKIPKIKALKNINLEIKKSELCAIIGPSGSGKSTLLNLISGLDKPTKGQIIFTDKELSCDKLRFQKIGLLFEEANLIEVLSCYENIEYKAILHNIPLKERHREISQIMQELGIEKLASKFPSEISQGEQQRVALARASVGSPSLIVADEPTAHLDTQNAIAIINLFEKLKIKRKTTIIFATHDNRLIKKADHIVFLKDGEIRHEIFK